MRTILAILAGLILAFLVIFVIEQVGHFLFPPPPGLAFGTPAEAAAVVGSLPFGALAFVVLAWFVGALSGAFLAMWIARAPLAGWVVALALVLLGIFNMTVVPHPFWMWAAGLGAPVLGGGLAWHFWRRGRRPL